MTQRFLKYDRGFSWCFLPHRTNQRWFQSRYVLLWAYIIELVFGPLKSTTKFSCFSHFFVLKSGEQGWGSGESARLPPMCPGFDYRTQRHMWVQFVVGSLPCSERFFSGYSNFPLCSKNHISKFHFWNPEPGIVKHFIISPWHSLCLILNLHLHF